MWSVVDNICNIADSNNIKLFDFLVKKFIMATFSKTLFVLFTHIIRLYESEVSNTDL